MRKIKNLSGKQLMLIGALGFVVGSVLHNVIYALTGVEEGVFFVLAVIASPLAFAFGVIKQLIGKK